ncbi:MAG: hypothetical protein KDD44_01965 [Bdellovibrionales bacterium]|nr:hypothetical protein [Bdellovibrionales bacterium]
MPESVLTNCLRLMLRPIARFCLRNSFTIQDLTALLKEALIEESQRELFEADADPNISRISAMTGIHRKDVRRLVRFEGHARSKGGLITRVIGQWLEDPDFTAKGGAPRTLSCLGDDSEFHSMVRRVSVDLNPYTVLAELERVGAVERDEGTIRLRERMYIPKGNPEEFFKILAADTDDLIQALEHNVFSGDDVPHLHLRTFYDNVLPSKVPQIKRWLLREGSLFHQKVSRYLAKYDRDVNPKLREEPGSARVAVGAFSFVEGEVDRGDDGEDDD